jgi:hypothetical protein
MPTDRQGLNTTLSYMQGSTNNAYQVRANLVTHGMTVLFSQSQARVRGAFYPHRLTSAQFAVNVQLVGEDEYVSFTNWLATYAAYILDINLAFGEFPSMVVQVPSVNFMRRGVPLTGYEWGDRVGAMLWEIPMTFESAGEPLDTAPVLSSVQGYHTNTDPDVQYFYPTGTQLGGNSVPADGTYTPVSTAATLAAATAATSAAAAKVATAAALAAATAATNSVINVPGTTNMPGVSAPSLDLQNWHMP